MTWFDRLCLVLAAACGAFVVHQLITIVLPAYIVLLQHWH